MQNRRNVATFISGQRNIPRQEEFNCCTALRRRRPFPLVSWEVRITWIVTYVCVARCMWSILAFGACCLLLWLAGSGCSPKGVISRRVDSRLSPSLSLSPCLGSKSICISVQTGILEAAVSSDLLAGISRDFWDSLAGPDLPGGVSLDAQHDLSTFWR